MEDINTFYKLYRYMAEVRKQVSKATSENIKIGTLVEKAEHPWASKQTARKIASDHVKENPNYYTRGQGGETATVNVRIKQIRPKKKVPPPPPSNAPEWINPGFRIWG
jgi:hypothetical protein